MLRNVSVIANLLSRRVWDPISFLWDPTFLYGTIPQRMRTGFYPIRDYKRGVARDFRGFYPLRPLGEDTSFLCQRFPYQQLLDQHGTLSGTNEFQSHPTN